jgi:hypothetical protein
MNDTQPIARIDGSRLITYAIGHVLTRLTFTVTCLALTNERTSPNSSSIAASVLRTSAKPYRASNLKHNKAAVRWE